MHLILLKMLFIKFFWYKERMVSLLTKYIVNVVSMHSLATLKRIYEGAIIYVLIKFRSFSIRFRFSMILFCMVSQTIKGIENLNDTLKATFR